VKNFDNSQLAGSPEAGGLNHATSVAVSGNTAYVTAWGGDALTAFNIATPASPIPLWTYKDTTNLVNPNDVAVSGNFAYVVNQVSGGMMQLTVFQLNSNPALPPTLLATLSDNAVLGGAYRIRVQGDFAYVSGNAVSSVGAIDISNPAAPRVAGSVNSSLLSNVDGLSIAGGGRYLVTTAPLLSSETATAFPPYPLQTGGPTNTGTVSVIDLEPTPIQASISAEPANPTSQTSANFSFGANDAVAAMECSLDGAPLAPCTSPTSASYSSLSPGPHTFPVQATDSTGATSQATYAWTINKSSTPPPPPPGSSAPKVTKAPNISGTAQQGKTLTASTGTWSGSPAPTFRYKWERCTSRGCTAISNQTGRTYRVTLADVGDRLEVVVTASNVAGSASSSFTDPSAVKWSAASFATANLTGAKTAHPGFNLSVPSPGSNLKLKQLVIALPTGISPAALHRLAAGTSVRDLKGKRLAFTARLSHGKLTLSFKKPPTGVKVKIASGFVTISASLHRKLKRSKPSEKLSLTLNYSGKPARRGTVKLHLS
jgi:LVIVD repeat